MEGKGGKKRLEEGRNEGRMMWRKDGKQGWSDGRKKRELKNGRKRRKR